MAIEVPKVILKHVQDASGLEERILAGQFTADEVVAVIGKREEPARPGPYRPYRRSCRSSSVRLLAGVGPKRKERVPRVWAVMSPRSTSLPLSSVAPQPDT